jgi:hypothetical protein
MSRRMARNPIDQELERIATQESEERLAPVAKIARKYDAVSSKRLLGFLLSLDYDELSIVTCDLWKRACGGVPRNSFVMIKLSPASVDKEDRPFCDRIILARVTDSVPTPVERDIQGTVFQLHKVQAIPDPVTNKELQWSARLDFWRRYSCESAPTQSSSDWRPGGGLCSGAPVAGSGSSRSSSCGANHCGWYSGEAPWRPHATDHPRPSGRGGPGHRRRDRSRYRSLRAVHEARGGGSRRGDTVCTVLSGGNIDGNLLARVIEQVMVWQGRYILLKLAVVDRPGTLSQLIDRIAEVGANVIDIFHRRAVWLAPLGKVGLELVLEVRDEAHGREVIEYLEKVGYHVQRGRQGLWPP